MANKRNSNNTNKNGPNKSVRGTPTRSANHRAGNGGTFGPTSQRIVRRSLWKMVADQASLLAPSSQDEITGDITNTKFSNSALSATLGEYFPAATGGADFLRTVDQFKIESIDIYCDTSRIPFSQEFRRVQVWFKPDFDDNNVITWEQLQQRDGVMMTTLSPTDKPLVKLCSIKPVADFRSTSVAGDPSNMIANPHAWFDVVAVNQNFVGLKIHCEVNSPSAETFTPKVQFLMKANFVFRGQV